MLAKELHVQSLDMQRRILIEHTAHAPAQLRIKLKRTNAQRQQILSMQRLKTLPPINLIKCAF